MRLPGGTVEQVEVLGVAVSKLINGKCRRPLDGSGYGFLEQALVVAIVQGQLCYDGVASARLAHDGDVVGIAAESRNVLLDPLNAHALVEQARVGGWQRRVSHETERPKTVADINSDEILALANPVAKVVVGSCAELQAAALCRE